MQLLHAATRSLSRQQAAHQGNCQWPGAGSTGSRVSSTVEGSVPLGAAAAAEGSAALDPSAAVEEPVPSGVAAAAGSVGAMLPTVEGAAGESRPEVVPGDTVGGSAGAAAGVAVAAGMAAGVGAAAGGGDGALGLAVGGRSGAAGEEEGAGGAEVTGALGAVGTCTSEGWHACEDWGGSGPAVRAAAPLPPTRLEQLAPGVNRHERRRRRLGVCHVDGDDDGQPAEQAGLEEGVLRGAARHSCGRLAAAAAARRRTRAGAWGGGAHW